tara:strand:+ start:308 stop:670 length:363 start_codon:yes stop_codon:yes gene_type:complete
MVMSNQSLEYHFTKNHWHQLCDAIRVEQDVYLWQPWLKRITFLENKTECNCEMPTELTPPWIPHNLDCWHYGDVVPIFLRVPNHLYREFIQANLEMPLLKTAWQLFGARCTVAYLETEPA